MELLPPELLNQLPLLAQVFDEADPLLYAKLSSPGETWHFYIFAIDCDGTCVVGFVDAYFMRFCEVQWCPFNGLNELSRRWGTGGSYLIRDVTFIPCRHSQVKPIWGDD